MACLTNESLVISAKVSRPLSMESFLVYSIVLEDPLYDMYTMLTTKSRYMFSNFTTKNFSRFLNETGLVRFIMHCQEFPTSRGLFRSQIRPCNFSESCGLWQSVPCDESCIPLKRINNIGQQLGRHDSCSDSGSNTWMSTLHLVR